MARVPDEKDIKKIENEEGHIHVLCWDNKQKKQIFDYIPKKRLRELMKKDYVLAHI